MKIAVIGAGITGLSAAYKLSEKGHKVVVYERGEAPGGLGTYLKVKDNYIERFYHHFFQSDKEIINIAKELGLSKKLKFYKAKTGVYSGGKIYPFAGARDLLMFSPVPLVDRVRCGIATAFLKFIPIVPKYLDKVPAGEWIKKYEGNKIYEKVWGPLLEGKFSKYSNRISALWLWGRVKDRSPKLGYFDGSVKVMFDAMIKRLEKRKVEIKLKAEITSIEQKEKIVIKGTGIEEEFDKVIVTTVSPIAEMLIKNSIDGKLRKHLASIDQLGAICLILELKKSVQSQYWLNICEKKSKVLVMVEHTNMVDKKYYGGRTIVYLANYIHRSDPRFRMTDEQALEQYTQILKQINPSFGKSWILKSYISRVPRAQTIFNTNAYKKLPPFKLSENIFLANIDQMYPYDRNLDQGIELGKKVAGMVMS